MKLSEIKVDIKNEKQIKALIIIMILHYWMMYLYDILCYIPDRFFDRVVDVALHIIITLPVFLVYKKIGLYKESIDVNNKKQYTLIIPCALIFFVSCAVVFGLDFKNESYVIMNSVLWWLFYFVVVVAVTEEFVFRVYMLGELSVLLGKAKWLAPIISGVMFGVVHWVNMGLESVYMNIMVGIALGYMKLYIKNCTFLTCVLAHGLYDFVITITGW